MIPTLEVGVGGTEEFRSRGRAADRCQLGKILIEPGRTTTFQYSLTISCKDNKTLFRDVKHTT